MVRSVMAVVLGFLAAAAIVVATTFAAAAALDVAWGEPTPTYLVLNLLGGALAGVVGGHVAASMPERRGFAHAVVLAAVFIVLSLPGAIGGGMPDQPAWYPWVLLVLAPASVLLGGRMAVGRPGGG